MLCLFRHDYSPPPVEDSGDDLSLNGGTNVAIENDECPKAMDAEHKVEPVTVKMSGSFHSKSENKLRGFLLRGEAKRSSLDGFNMHFTKSASDSGTASSVMVSMRRSPSPVPSASTESLGPNIHRSDSQSSLSRYDDIIDTGLKRPIHKMP